MIGTCHHDLESVCCDDGFDTRVVGRDDIVTCAARNRLTGNAHDHREARDVGQWFTG
jgi:hypothetical protein